MSFSSQRPIITGLSQTQLEPNTTNTVRIYGYGFHPDSVVQIAKHLDISGALPPTIDGFTVESPNQINVSITTNAAQYNTVIRVVSGPDKTSTEWPRGIGVGYIRVISSARTWDNNIVMQYTAQETPIMHPSITVALSNANSGDVIEALPGVYYESVVVPNGVMLRGVGATIVSEDNKDAVTLSPNATVENITIRALGTHSGIVFDDKGDVFVKNVTINGDKDPTPIGINNKGTGTISLENVTFEENKFNIAINNIGAIIGSNIKLYSTANTFYNSDGGNGKLDFVTIDETSVFVSTAFRMNSGGLFLNNSYVYTPKYGLEIFKDSTTVEFTNVRMSCNTDFYVDSDVTGDHVIVKWSGNHSSIKHDVRSKTFWQNAYTAFNYLDTYDNPSVKLENTLSQGATYRPSVSSFGEGGDYNSHMMVFTWDSANGYKDITAEAVSTSGSTFTFSSNTVGSRIYISSDAWDSSGLRHKFPGVILNVSFHGNYGAGRIGVLCGVPFFANVPFEVRSMDGLTHYGKRIGSYEGKQVIRLSSGAITNWAMNQPVPLVDHNTYWFVLEIQNNSLDVLPVFESMTLLTNSVSYVGDGFGPIYYGSARPLKKLDLDYGTLDAVVIQGQSSALAQDLYISDNIGVGRLGNAFNNAANRYVGVNAIIPHDVDTSEPIKVMIKYISRTAGGNFVFTIRYGWTYDTEPVYYSTGLSPAVATHEMPLLSQTIATPPVGVQSTMTFNLDISDMILQDSNTPSKLPVLWITMGRPATSDPNDTNGGYIYGIQMMALYTAVANGGHN